MKVECLVSTSVSLGRTVVMSVLLAILDFGASQLAAQEPCIAPVRSSSRASSSATQPPPCPVPPGPHPWPAGVSHAVDLAANVGLGALTAGVRAGLAGRPFWPAFKHGAVGGGVTYAGKRIIGTQQPALGIVGREVTAVGTSLIRNAAGGRAAFASLVLPVGPLRVYVGEPHVRLKLDFAGSIGVLYTASHPGAHLDVRASLLAGAPVIVYSYTGGPIHIAESNAGTIGVVDYLGTDGRRRAIAHELIHVVQYDFTFLVWGEPVEDAILPHLPAGTTVRRYVDLGANMAILGLAYWAVPYDQSPWEHEAELMTDRPWP